MGYSPLATIPTRTPERLDAATAPVIAMTYSSVEFAKYPAEAPWQLAFRAIVASGAVPLAIDCSTPQPRMADLVRLADGLLVLGGVDIDPKLYGGDESDPLLDGINPLRDQNELKALSTARELGRPVLAICRGFQLLNVACGGRLIADLKRDHAGGIDHRPGMPALVKTQHDVTIEPYSILARWMSNDGRIPVNSQHHQGILTIGNGLRATAHSDDGLVEALESADGQTVGIQWHPEFIWSDDNHAWELLSGFATTCRAAREGRTRETAQ